MEEFVLPVRQLYEPGNRDVEDLLKPLNLICPNQVQSTLSGISQWGLKEVWVGTGIGQHDRWVHTQGVLAVAARWLHRLYGEERIAWKPQLLSDYDKAISLAGMAALLHDFGHLPFAHLVGQVLESINWVPRQAGDAGMEEFVLQTRLDGNPTLDETWRKLASKLEIEQQELLKKAVRDLIIGRFGIPWIQVLLNSAIDADKIDYLCRDSTFLQEAGWPCTSRLLTKPREWLEEFLSDQHVNHAGLLCLGGRSAVAAADLLRERVFLHDRFYLSPEIRVADRMAFEIVQQFLIRLVMSDTFRKQMVELSGIEGYKGLVGKAGDGPVEPIEFKGRLVAEMLDRLGREKATGVVREFDLLRYMRDQLKGCRTIASDYLSLLETCFNHLEGLQKDSRKIHELANDVLVREPLVLRREDYSKARDALRPVQHTYFREVLIDLVKLPRVLAVARRWRVGPQRRALEGVDYGLLVPEGPVSAWGPGSRPRVPLTDAAVSRLERPYARVIVVAPGGGGSARAEYVWDRVRSVLLEAGVRLESRTPAEVG